MRTPEGVRIEVKSAIGLVESNPFTVGDVLRKLHSAHDHVLVRRIVNELVGAGELERSSVANPKQGTRQFFARTAAFRADVYGEEEQLRSGKIIQNLALAWGAARLQAKADEHAD